MRKLISYRVVISTRSNVYFDGRGLKGAGGNHINAKRGEGPGFTGIIIGVNLRILKELNDPFRLYARKIDIGLPAPFFRFLDSFNIIEIGRSQMAV